jgi:hypothetical protein
MRSRSLAFALAIVLAAAVTASAAPFSTFNSGRPLTPALGLTDIQTRLDAIYGGAGLVDALNGQSNAGAWYLPGNTPNGTLPVLQFQSGAFANDVAFGIWSGSDDTAIATEEIFTAGASPYAMASLFWTDPFTLTISGGPGVNSRTVNTINRYGFGFYISSPESPTGKWFSADALNGGAPQMLAYSGPGGRWSFFFEDLAQQDNYIDLVVSSESIMPVPEPASMLLFGTGLVGLGRAWKKRRQ